MTVFDQVQRAHAAVPSELLEDVVHRVVDVADPEKIVLFGFAARGEMRPTSDLDLLVIKDGDYDYHRIISALYRTLAKVPNEVDVVLVTSAQAERYRNSRCLVIHPALKEGKVIYDRAALRS